MLGHMVPGGIRQSVLCDYPKGSRGTCLTQVSLETWSSCGLWVLTVQDGYQPQIPRPSSQHKEDVFVPGRQRAGNKSQSQEIEDEREGERNKGDGQRYLSQRWEDCFWIDRRQTWAIGKWQFTKIKGGNLVLG